MATFDGRASRTVVRLEAARKESSQSFVATTGDVVLHMKGIWPNDHLPGDRLIIRARLKRPGSYASPGSFDYARFLAQKDIWVTGFIKSPLFIDSLDPPINFMHRVRYIPELIRTHLGNFINNSLDAETGGMYRALLLGDRAAVPDHILEHFKASGTLHILAISGIHMAIVGSFFYITIYWLLSRSAYLLLNFPVPRLSAFFTLPPLVSYALITGMNNPATRAVLMGSIVILATLCLRRCTPGTLIASAAFLILFYDPLQLSTASFQLSFSAVCGILFLLPRVKHFISAQNKNNRNQSLNKRICRWLLTALLVSTTATLATLPISIIHFHRISVVGPLANLVIEPLLCLWALPFGIIAMLFSSCSPSVGSLLLKAGSFGIEAALTLAQFFSSFNFSSIWLPTPADVVVYIYYGAMILLLLQRRPNCLLALPTALLFSMSLMILIIPNLIPRNTDSARSKIAYLDVGQGSATFIEFQSGEKVLIDGGGSSWSKITVGEKVIAPYLWSQGINKLDAVIITHPDGDHCNGIGFIIDHFKPKTLWLRSKTEMNPHLKKLFDKAALNKVEIEAPRAGQLLSEQGNYLECLYNFAEISHYRSQKRSRAKENAGLIIKACVDNQCALFPGDISTGDEHHLISRGVKMQSAVYLAAHHGSKTSNSNEFLDMTAPSYVVVSAGSGRPSHFPHSSLIQKCDSRGIRLLNTAAYGTIEFLNLDSNPVIYNYIKHQDNPLYPFQKKQQEYLPPALKNQETVKY